jgi:capsular exopolysaccharide synthesis family protein
VRQHVIGLLVSLIIGGCLGVVLFFLLMWFTPFFTSEVLFEVRPGLAASTEIGTSKTLKDDEVERIARTQTELLMQRDVLRQAILSPQVRDTNWMTSYFLDPQTGQPLIEQAVDELEETLQTPVLRGTNLFAIRWAWSIASDVPKVLNSIASAYMEKLTVLDDAQFTANEKLFDNQLRLLQMGLRDIGDDVHTFIVAKGITTLDDPRFSQVSIVVQDLSKNLTELQTERTSVQAMYQQTAMKLEGTVEASHEDILLVEADSIVLQQLSRLELMKTDERILREQFNEGMPQVESIELQVRSLEEQIRLKKDEVLHRNLNAQLKTLSSERERIDRVTANIEEELAAKDALLRDLAADTSRYQAMKTKQLNYEKQRDDSQQLLSEIRLMKLRSDASRVRQISLAELPREPSFPKPELIVPGTIVVCFGIFVGWIFLRELLEKRIRSLSDLAVIPGITVLGAVADIEDDPAEPEDAEMVLREFPDSVTAESCRQVAIALLRTMANQGHSTLLLTGAMPGAGTTTIVGNMACAIASAGHSVCVVDANFRRPRLAETFGVHEGVSGLGDALKDSEALGQSIHETESGVAVVPAGTESSRLVERLVDERFGVFMASVRTKFDYVLVDSAPAVAATDAIQIAARCDASVIIVRAGNEQRGLVARLVRELSEASAEFIGSILNRPRQSIGGYFRRNYELMATYGQSEGDDES